MRFETAYTHARILDRILETPKTIAEIAQELGVHKENVRKPIRKMHEDGMVHISEYRIHGVWENQRTMVFSFGPGEDAARVTFGEMKRKVRIVDRPEYEVKRDSFIAALFGAA